MNYYEILGVTPDSSTVEIKAAYRKLVRQFHPDVNPQGARKFKDVSIAYDTLIDEEKRKQYDILNGLFKSTKSFSDELENNEEDIKNDDKSDFGNSGKNVKKTVKSRRTQKKFSEVINKFFDNASESDKAPVNGSDINSEILITMLESLNGTSKNVNILRTELCPRCKGRKFINGTKCNVCGGSGEYSQYKRINVVIPKNIKSGTKLRLKGEGEAGLFGGKNGDLYILVKIEDNSNIKYEGLDVIYKVPITPYEAVLGTEIILPSLGGHLKVKVPPRTISGQKFRIAGQGVSKNGKTGDVIVVVTIEIPKDLSDEEVNLYEKLKKLSGTNIRENLLND